MSARPQQQRQPKQQQQEVSYEEEEEDTYTGKIIKFTEDEAAFIQDVIVTLRNAIPNDMGENSEILEKIVMCEQILSARMSSGDEGGDNDAIGMGNSGGTGQG